MIIKYEVFLLSITLLWPYIWGDCYARDPIWNTPRDAPTFSFLGHSHGWQMTISSGLKVHGQKGWDQRRDLMKKPVLQWKPLVDVNIWNMISLFGTNAHFLVPKHNPPKKPCHLPKKKHHLSPPKKKKYHSLVIPKNPPKNINNQPTNEPTNDNTRKKNRQRHDHNDVFSSSLTSFQRHLYQGQTLIETSLHLILPALSLPFGRVSFINNGWWVVSTPGPSPSFRGADVLEPGGWFSTQWKKYAQKRQFLGRCS